ncbi:membrane protein [Vibrio galatheae]|uniref:Membrane protein n=1 Tax=Vibrio galatheae TaxID=579748 RepID=A0A0F4NI19_9VIBR|nr:OmpA family protein [Vibrio galatheae]KJY81711.1 membrane protein [Vibrio galatheae]
MNKLAAVISGALVLSSMNANANFYLGGKVGKAWLNDACTSVTVNCDDDSATLGLLGGYEFLDWLALEAGYDYLGDYTVDGVSDDSIGAWTLAPKFTWHFNDSTGVYAKLGAARVDYGSANDTTFLGAVGFEFFTTDPITVRLEYQQLTDVGGNWTDATAHSATLGFIYKFGHGAQTEPEPYVAEEMVAEEVVEEVVVTPVVKMFEAKAIDSGAFAVNSTELKTESVPMLEELVEFMKQYPQSNVEITGYTDSRGAAAYNQTLSEKRAQSVADVLVKEGIDSSRITATGEGENNPIASNETREGRAQNRRVEIVVPAFEYQE